jgi:hypothetical protein
MMDDMMKKRAKELSDLGLLYNGDSFVYKDINFHWTDLVCMTDSEFKEALKGATERLEVLKKEQKNG